MLQTIVWSPCIRSQKRCPVRACAPQRNAHKTFCGFTGTGSLDDWRTRPLNKSLDVQKPRALKNDCDPASASNVDPWWTRPPQRPYRVEKCITGRGDLHVAISSGACRSRIGRRSARIQHHLPATFDAAMLAFAASPFVFRQARIQQPLCAIFDAAMLAFDASPSAFRLCEADICTCIRSSATSEPTRFASVRSCFATMARSTLSLVASHGVAVVSVVRRPLLGSTEVSPTAACGRRARIFWYRNQDFSLRSAICFLSRQFGWRQVGQLPNQPVAHSTAQEQRSD